MRIAVTGASGFIGSALVPTLAARGHAVVALDRAAIGDVAAVSDWRPLITGVRGIVHLAALAHAGSVDERRLRAVNVDAALALGKAAAAAGARLVFISSVKAQDPRDAYGRAKADAERALWEVEGLELVVLRSPLVYGPGVKGNFLSLMRGIARGWPLPLASIANRRSLLYVGNLCDAIATCLTAAAAAGRSYAIADGAAVSTPALCRALGEALGRPARLFPFPPALLPIERLTGSLEIDDSAIRRELGWRPPFFFEHGLQATAAWYREYR